MLLIWDLHINSRVKDRLIDGMRKYIKDNNDERNIIFLWDYVYHFSYDRVALLALYNFFLELFAQGKNVYVLAWNHDRLWNTFVFEEARRTFEIMSQQLWDNETVWKIDFITEPKVENIEWAEILFLPNFLETKAFLEKKNMDCFVNSQWQLDEKYSDYDEIVKTIEILSESKKKNELVSADVNKILLNYVQKYTQENKKLTVIHHYYVEWINFPWQRGRFYFNDVAISKLFCDLENIKMISGHLHQWFVHKNYFCTGSTWNTSPLEINQAKGMFKYADNRVYWKMMFINPYFMIEDINKKEKNSLFEAEDSEQSKILVDDKFVENFILKVIADNISNYKNLAVASEWVDNDIYIYNKWIVGFDEKYELDNKDISISMQVEDVNYDEIYNYIDEELFKKLKDVKLKKNLVVTKDLFDKMDVEWKNLSEWFSDWKGLLKEYLTNKYPEDFDKYLDFLKGEKIL